MRIIFIYSSKHSLANRIQNVTLDVISSLFIANSYRQMDNTVYSMKCTYDYGATCVAIVLL